MKRIFVLEDDPRRITTILKWATGPLEWDIVSSCEQADQFKPPYDLMLLDHDLGGRQMEVHEDNGLAFIRLIKARINEGARTIIHSYNPDGAKAMLAELGDRAEIIPFGTVAYINALKETLDG